MLLCRIKHCSNFKVIFLTAVCVVILWIIWIRWQKQAQWQRFPNVSDISHQTAKYCHPKSNIFFLKTHKCASSTIQNIFLRYGYAHHLNFVLPSLGNYLGNQGPFHHSMAATSPWHKLGYNIFCHHTVFNKPEMAKIMPNDTFYVTILRHPVTLFESLYEYADLNLKYGVNFEEFVKNTSPSVNISLYRASGYLGVNQMAYDMGINPRKFNTEEIIRDEIQRLDNQFDFVMISEYFDHSLVLLADKLCWNKHDLTYFKHNIRKTDEKQRRQFNAKTTRKIELLNSADMQIYDFFMKKFEKHVKHYGGWNKLQKDVEKLRLLNENLKQFCVQSNTSVKHFEFVFQADKVEELGVKSDNNTCQQMSWSEIYFTKKLKMTQLIKASKNIQGFSAREIGRAHV